MKPISNARYVSLATWRKNGKEVRTPIWFASHNAGTHYCFSAENAGKVKRIRHTSRCRLAVCDARGGDLQEWAEFNAFLVTEDNESKLAYSLLLQKYGLQMRVTNFFSWLTGKIKHRAVIRLESAQASDA
ncbi:MAG: pyridoxamine 5'-phosphate oxidase family protein [Pseudomonadales bacterium]|jgi:PPOX class probable F420-dependent enzyme